MDLKVVTKRAPTERELADLRFAFRVAKHVKSNAIVYARDGATVGIGAGQMSRVEFLPHRRLEGRGSREGRGPARDPRARLGGRLRRLLPLRRRPSGRGRGRRHRGDPARRLHARRRGHQGRRRGGPRHGVHGASPFPALMPLVSDAPDPAQEPAAGAEEQDQHRRPRGLRLKQPRGRRHRERSEERRDFAGEARAGRNSALPPAAGTRRARRLRDEA